MKPARYLIIRDNTTPRVYLNGADGDECEWTSDKATSWHMAEGEAMRRLTRVRSVHPDAAVVPSR